MKKFFAILVIAVIAVAFLAIPAEARRSHNYGADAAAAQFVVSGIITPAVFKQCDAYMAKNYPSYKSTVGWYANSAGFTRLYESEAFNPVAVTMRWSGELLIDGKVVGTWTVWSPPAQR